MLSFHEPAGKFSAGTYVDAAIMLMMPALFERVGDMQCMIIIGVLGFIWKFIQRAIATGVCLYLKTGFKNRFFF